MDQGITRGFKRLSENSSHFLWAIFVMAMVLSLQHATCSIDHGLLAAVVGGDQDKAIKTSESSVSAADKPEDAARPGRLALEKRISTIENVLGEITKTSVRLDERSYVNKMMGRELVNNSRIMVAVLIIIAVTFPISLWLLSRKRLIGLSGLSSEVTATLLAVEERQARLGNILRELQDELEMVHSEPTSTSPSQLRKLIEQAEEYIKANEEDLAKTGTQPKSPRA